MPFNVVIQLSLFCTFVCLVASQCTSNSSILFLFFVYFSVVRHVSERIRLQDRLDVLHEFGVLFLHRFTWWLHWKPFRVFPLFGTVVCRGRQQVPRWCSSRQRLVNFLLRLSHLCSFLPHYYSPHSETYDGLPGYCFRDGCPYVCPSFYGYDSCPSQLYCMPCESNCIHHFGGVGFDDYCESAY